MATIVVVCICIRMTMEGEIMIGARQFKMDHCRFEVPFGGDDAYGVPPRDAAAIWRGDHARRRILPPR